MLRGLLRPILAAACLVGAVAAYRFVVHPWIESALGLDPATSSVVRRVDLFAVVLLTYWAFVHFVERRAASELAPRWKWILVSGAAGALSIGVTIVALYAAGLYRLVGVQGLAPAAGVLGTLAVAAVLEEVAFRCILFRLLAESVGTRTALVASALVFGVAHLSNRGAGWVTFVMVTLAGLMWAGVFLLSRNLWVTAAHHLCWNATIFALGLPLSGEEDVRAAAPLRTLSHGPALWTGGAFGPEDSLIDLVVLAGICLLLWRLARRSPSGRGPWPDPG